MTLCLPMCCMDFEIDPLDLLLPARLSPDAYRFLTVHGIEAEMLFTLQQSARVMDNGKVRLSHRCAQLQDNGECRMYDLRPQICREFDCRERIDCACGGKGWRHA